MREWDEAAEAAGAKAEAVAMAGAGAEVAVVGASTTAGDGIERRKASACRLEMVGPEAAGVEEAG